MRKVVSLSMDDTVHNQLLSAALTENMTLSQYARKLFAEQQTSTKQSQQQPWPESLVALANARYAVIIASCIIAYDSKVLLVKRRLADSRVPLLSWAFPGGRLGSLVVTDNAQSLLQARCGLQVSLRPIAARVIPDTAPGQQVAALYFGGEAPTQNLQLSTMYSDARWVEPRAVFSHFTTSVSDDITRYLMSL